MVVASKLLPVSAVVDLNFGQFVIRPKKTSVLPVALLAKVGMGKFFFVGLYYFFQFLWYFSELRAIKR